MLRTTLKQLAFTALMFKPRTKNKYIVLHWQCSLRITYCTVASTSALDYSKMYPVSKAWK